MEYKNVIAHSKQDSFTETKLTIDRPDEKLLKMKIMCICIGLTLRVQTVSKHNVELKIIRTK